MTKAFEATKETLADATLLHHPVQGAPTALTTDASDTALGAVLEQKTRGNVTRVVRFSTAPPLVSKIFALQLTLVK
jgi:hypothetical protein